MGTRELLLFAIKTQSSIEVWRFNVLSPIKNNVFCYLTYTLKAFKSRLLLRMSFKHPRKLRNLYLLRMRVFLFQKQLFRSVFTFFKYHVVISNYIKICNSELQLCHHTHIVLFYQHKSEKPEQNIWIPYYLNEQSILEFVFTMNTKLVFLKYFCIRVYNYNSKLTSLLCFPFFHHLLWLVLIQNSIIRWYF